MKKIIIVIFSFLIFISLVGCKKEVDDYKLISDYFIHYTDLEMYFGRKHNLNFVICDSYEVYDNAVKKKDLLNNNYIDDEFFEDNILIIYTYHFYRGEVLKYNLGRLYIEDNTLVFPMDLYAESEDLYIFSAVGYEFYHCYLIELDRDAYNEFEYIKSLPVEHNFGLKKTLFEKETTYHKDRCYSKVGD